MSELSVAELRAEALFLALKSNLYTLRSMWEADEFKDLYWFHKGLEEIDSMVRKLEFEVDMKYYKKEYDPDYEEK